MASSESALVVLVPEAEVLVQPFRDKYDPSAAMGMPAHVTLLYPFLAPDEIGSAVLADLRTCFRRFPPFRFTLAETRRFPGVLYLGPEPDEPFRELTVAIWNRYPDYPPYGGRHIEIVPHLSVAFLADEQEVDAIATEFLRASTGQPPIQATTREAALMDNSSGHWQVRSKLHFGNHD